jgi:signal transduction histidine kinase
MEENQIFNPDGNVSIKTTKKLNGNSQINGKLYAISGEKKIGLDPLLVRLQEIERLNAILEKLLDQRTEELAESVAANAKSISIIAHDLRSPFCTVLTALEIMRDNWLIIIQMKMNVLFKLLPVRHIVRSTCSITLRDGQCCKTRTEIQPG